MFQQKDKHWLWLGGKDNEGNSTPSVVSLDKLIMATVKGNNVVIQLDGPIPTTITNGFDSNELACAFMDELFKLMGNA